MRIAELAIETREPTEPEIPRSVLDRNGELRASALEIAEDRLIALFRTMTTARRLDEHCVQLQRQGKIPFYLPGVGHEAVGAAMAYALTDQDWLFPGFRDLAAIVGRGVPLDQIAQVAFGSGAASTQGRVLPVYQIHRDHNIASSSAGGAAHLGHAVGVAWAARLRRDPLVALASFAGGAVSSGEFHAALNFAAVFKAPVVFVCHNEQLEAVAPLADGYGLPGVRVDGSDVLALIEILDQAIERARGGGGPTLIEATMPSGGRPDPLERLERHLRGRGLRLDTLIQGLDHEIEAALESASCAPAPDLQTLFTDVLATPRREP